MPLSVLFVVVLKCSLQSLENHWCFQPQGDKSAQHDLKSPILSVERYIFTRVCIKVDFNRHFPQRLSKNIYFYFFSLFLSNGFYLVSTLHCCGRKWTAIIQNLNCNNKCKILQNVKPYIENFWVCVRSSPFQTNLGWSINHVAKILCIFDPLPPLCNFY